jgi:hypothetical protein
MTRLEYDGIFTEGYYNEMEGGGPVFIDDKPLSEIVKELLNRAGLDDDFSHYGVYPELLCRGEHLKGTVPNPLIGKRVKLILEIEAE